MKTIIEDKDTISQETKNPEALIGVWGSSEFPSQEVQENWDQNLHDLIVKNKDVLDKIILEGLVSPESTLNYINPLFEEYNDSLVVDSIQFLLAQKIKKGEISVDIKSFLFLASLEKFTTLGLINEDLSLQMELYGAGNYSIALENEIAELLQQKGENKKFTFHNLLTFFKKYLNTVQSDTEAKLEKDYFPNGYNGTAIQILNCLNRVLKGAPNGQARLDAFKASPGLSDTFQNTAEYPLTDNFLLKKDIEDFVSMIKMFTNKEGDLDGVPGGQDDKNIFIHSNSIDSYKIRNTLGIKGGNAINNFFCEVAPGYVGGYINGSLKGIYAMDGKVDFEDMEQKLIEQNNPEDNIIYDLIASATEDAYLQSNKLQAFQGIWDLRKNLKAEGKTFYFDIKKLPENIHPFVRSNILIYNQEIISPLFGKILAESTEPLPLDQTKYLFFKNFDNEHLRKFEVFSSLHMRQKIENDLGVDISKFSFRVQALFLNFLNEKDIDVVDGLKNFCNVYGNVGIKTFLSMEQDESLGNNIVSFGESVDEKMAQKVFEKYSEIIDQSFLIEEFLSQEIDANINDEETIKNIREQLVVRAKDILTGFVENGGVSIEEIEDRLAKIKTDVLLLSQVLRSSMENGKRVSLSEIKNFSLEGHMSASNLSSEEKEIMKGIYKRNYESNPELQRILLKSHESSLTSEHSDFSVLRYKGEVTGFYRIDNKAPNEVYFAAFNIDPEFRGGGLGDELMLRNIGQISETKVIHADCAAFERVGAKYIETGFVGDRFYEFAGNPSLHIELDKKKEFSTKSMSKEKFVQEMLEFELKGYTGGVCKEGNYWIAKASNQDAIPMDIIKEHNTVLTRYFKYTLGNEEAWYAVFEEGK